jgi:hypothetical protein
MNVFTRRSPIRPGRPPTASACTLLIIGLALVAAVWCWRPPHLRCRHSSAPRCGAHISKGLVVRPTPHGGVARHAGIFNLVSGCAPLASVIAGALWVLLVRQPQTGRQPSLSGWVVRHHVRPQATLQAGRCCLISRRRLAEFARRCRWYWGSSFPSGHTLVVAAFGIAAALCIGRIWPATREFALSISIFMVRRHRMHMIDTAVPTV